MKEFCFISNKIPDFRLQIPTVRVINWSDSQERISRSYIHGQLQQYCPLGNFYEQFVRIVEMLEILRNGSTL